MRHPNPTMDWPGTVQIGKSENDAKASRVTRSSEAWYQANRCLDHVGVLDVFFICHWNSCDLQAMGHRTVFARPVVLP